MCGYHIYISIWDAVIGEELPCERETGNKRDRYVVAVITAGETVGHFPRKIFHPCSLFLRRGNSITCCMTGHQRYFSDLSQGGLKILCILLFEAEIKDIAKIKKLVK